VRILMPPSVSFGSSGGLTLPGGSGRGAGNRTRAAGDGAAAGCAAQRDVGAGGHASLAAL